MLPEQHEQRAIAREAEPNVKTTPEYITTYVDRLELNGNAVGH